MLTDYWVIAQLLSQFCSVALLFGVSFFSVELIKKWNIHLSDESQLFLERKSYLVGSILQIVLFFQVLSLLMFLVTVNEHLTTLVKGAMCATGVLETNMYGTPLLYLKSLAIFVYLSFLILNYLDNSEPNYPLTPFKYYLVIPSFLLLLVDLVLMLAYFYNIDPDIISNCCSVQFIGDVDTSLSFLSSGQYSQEITFAFVALFITLAITLKKSFAIFIAIPYVITAIYSLKYFFVKYIYGLPSHNCLFDIFFKNYNYVGYLIYGSYYLLLASLLFSSLKNVFASKLKTSHQKLQKNNTWLSFVSLLVSFAVPVLYWLFWDGAM